MESNPSDERRPRAVAPVADHRMTHFGEVNADLMLAARFELHAHERGIGETLENLEVRDGSFSRAAQVGRAHRKGLRVLDEPGLDGPCVLLDAAFHERGVDTARLAGFELSGHGLERVRGLCERQQPGRVPIQSMHDEQLRPLDAAPLQGFRDALGEAFFGVSGRRTVTP